jgi:hypothetical protein
MERMVFTGVFFFHTEITIILVFVSRVYIRIHGSRMSRHNGFFLSLGGYAYAEDDKV